MNLQKLKLLIMTQTRFNSLKRNGSFVIRRSHEGYYCNAAQEEREREREPTVGTDVTCDSCPFLGLHIARVKRCDLVQSNLIRGKRFNSTPRDGNGCTSITIGRTVGGKELGRVTFGSCLIRVF